MTPENNLAGERLGPWLVESRIGAGGQGEIYRATRVDGQFTQTVAIKVLYAGFLNSAALRRFEAEQETLAALHHPYIANLLGTGFTSDGRAYFAMEYVEGKPIDEYANERALSISDRVALFAKVCEAVAYAHSRLVVHLDLKPANILVTEDGNPKLLDFGLAIREAAASRETDSFSRGSASPEQVTPGAVLSTLSDVYSLGAILYELLSGHPVITAENLSEEAAVHAIREEEPRKPSIAATRSRHVFLSAERTVELAPRKIAEMRGLSSGELRRRLQGDLDNIALVALRKEPGRRYPSVEEFARDLDRHLRGKRVHARAASPAYQAVRAARRSPLFVAAAALVCSVLFANWVLPRSIEQSEQTSRGVTRLLRTETCLVAEELETKVAPLAAQTDHQRVLRIAQNIRRESGCVSSQ